jgi:SWI/SNF-related matrix-associated actin-dependent regulator 1 of chromatin subfamily A
MQLTYRNDRFIAACSYDERHAAKEAGFRWDQTAKHWWTNDAAKAARLIDYADEQATAKLSEISRASKASAAADVETASEANPMVRYAARKMVAMLASDAPAPYPFQIAGASIMSASQRGSGILGDDMGLGKTPQAIMYAANLMDANPDALVLVVCPASVAPNWCREFDRWCSIQPTRIEGTRAPFLPKRGVIVAPYSVVGSEKVLAALSQRTFAALICDEFQYIKTPTAARTKAVWETLRSRASHVWCLSGTPVPNRPREIAHICAALAPDVFQSEWKFLQRYCGPQQVWTGRKYATTYDGATNLDELAQKLRGSILIRRTKAQVLTELPTKRREIIVLDGGTAARSLDMSGLDIAAVREQISNGSIPAFDEISKVRHDEAMGRVKSTVEWLTNELEQDDQPLCVFVHHKDVGHAIAKGCQDAGHLPIYVDGDTSPEHRQAQVDAFAGGTGRLFIGTIGACGTGINGLQKRATKVIMAESSWTPGDNEQAEDRVCRIGAVADQFIRVVYLVSDGGIDTYVLDLVLSKMANIQTIVREADAVAEAQRITVKPTGPDAPSGRTIDPALVTTIMAAVRKMQACNLDAATVENEIGFNQFDTPFGAKMAGVTNPTDRQVIATARMLAKYARTQVPEAADAIRAVLATVNRPQVQS